MLNKFSDSWWTLIWVFKLPWKRFLGIQDSGDQEFLVHLKGLYNSCLLYAGFCTQNLLAEILDAAPSIIHEMILPLGWLSGGCGSTGFSHCLNYIILVRTKARDSFTQETSPWAVPAKHPFCCSGFLVLAIELLAACQGIEFLRPLRTTTPLEKVYDLVRSVVR